MIESETNGHTDPQTGPEESFAGTLRLSVSVEITDHEVIQAISRHAEGEPRDSFVRRALRIGVLAMDRAVGEIDAEKVRRESDRLLETLGHRLTDHSSGVHDRVSHVLKQYFDPESGQLHDRLQRLTRRDGELEQLLAKHVGEQDSELAKTLTSHLGASSPLLKWLSPDQSQGLLAALHKCVDEQLNLQRDAVLKQFSLDNKEGALCRFLGELDDRHGRLSKGLASSVADVVKEFSLDDENSALSRLVANVTKAEKRITSEFSLDEENSALARLRREILNTLKEQDDSAKAFQEEVKGTLREFAARRTEAAASTRHGHEFEGCLCDVIEAECNKLGDIPHRAGNTTGSIKHCKTGDMVIVLGPDAAAAGAKVVVEAKEDASYTVKHALEEIEQARKNREAQSGLFVFSSKCAPASVPPITRYGNDVVIVWDSDDPASDLYLRVGLSLARALCIRHGVQRESQAADFSAIDTAVLEIQRQTERLQEIETWIGTIESSCNKIRERERAVHASLGRQATALNERVADLKVVLSQPNDAGLP